MSIEGVNAVNPSLSGRFGSAPFDKINLIVSIEAFLISLPD